LEWLPHFWGVESSIKEKLMSDTPFDTEKKLDAVVPVEERSRKEYAFGALRPEPVLTFQQKCERISQGAWTLTWMVVRIAVALTIAVGVGKLTYYSAMRPW
jgi:hypothetical protein